MLLSRFVLSALIAGLSIFAININAETNTTALITPAQGSAASSTAASGTADAKASLTSHKTVHKKNSHPSKKAGAKVSKLDINSADEASLAKVRMIGAKKAAVIVAYRTKNGPFKSVEDLKDLTNAKGKPLFSAKSLKAIDKHLEVNSSVASAEQSTSTQ